MSLAPARGHGSPPFQVGLPFYAHGFGFTLRVTAKRPSLVQVDSVLSRACRRERRFDVGGARVRTIDRYILKEVTLSWLAVTGVLYAVLLSQQLAQVLGQAAERGYPKEILLSLIGLMSLQNGTLLLPVGVLLGISLALGRLYHDSEMAALRACGVGPLRLLRAIGVLGLVVTGACAWAVLDLAPAAFARAQTLQKAAIQAAEFGLLEPGKFHAFAHGTAVFYAESADRDGTLRKIFIQRRADDHVEVMLADQARHIISPDGSLHTLVLYDGERFDGSPGNPVMRRVRFAEHGIPVRMDTVVGGAARVEARTTGDLRRDGSPEATAELQWRISLPLMVLILTLLAVPLAELEPRQGRYARVGLVILTFFIYTNLLSVARTWLEKGLVPAYLGLWWPHALALLLAAMLWWRRSPPQWAFR
jgi:lipopolysaccharide export system permease protein